MAIYLKRKKGKLNSVFSLSVSQPHRSKKTYPSPNTNKLKRLGNSLSRMKKENRIYHSIFSVLLFEILYVAYLIVSQGIRHLLFTHISFDLNEYSFALFINIIVLRTFFLLRPFVMNFLPG